MELLRNAIIGRKKAYFVFSTRAEAETYLRSHSGFKVKSITVYAVIKSK